LIAAIGVALEHVEGGSAGRKEDGLATKRESLRALDGFAQRTCDFTFGRVAPIMRNALGDFADKNSPAHLARNERTDGVEGEPFVFSAGDENDRFGCA